MRSKSIFVIVSLFLLLGCGGGSDGGTTPPETDLKGRFIDSAVSGMRYAATPSGMTGTTDANGTFTYEAGDTISFSIGNILVGTVTAAPVLTPISLVPGAVDENNLTVQNIARLLQTLDANDNPADGITISAEVSDAAMNVEPITFSDADFESIATSLLNTIYTSVGTTPPMLVSASDAAMHLAGTLLSQRAGSYSGTWVQTAGPGTDNGIWTFTVDSNGNATGCGTSTAGNFTLAGTASSSGDVEIASGTTSNGASFSGTVGLDGTVSGTWTNSAAGTSGTYTGSRTTGPVISCPGSSQPAEPTPVPAPVASYGSLAISGVDTSSIGTSFNAGSGELNVNFTTTTVNTYSWYDEVTSALTDGASLEVVFVPGTMTTINYVFSTLSGTSVFYAYSLTKLSNDVVIVNEA